ncbi:pyroglutamyl-peptidase I [Paucibacter soli]|uniref:pyroglutamyl-peptidase I n=1 Tax=Paucibacter soli TaxID=3133433 RepID=UPI00309EA8E1
MKRGGVILLTGFEPFGGEHINPSWEVARALDGELIAGARVQALQLPCVFGAALQGLAQGIAQHRPAMVLALGQAAGRSELSVERVAINVDDARIADNRGSQPIDEAVIAGAPAAYFSTLPIKSMVAALRVAGYPAGVSQSAGTFVCNHLFYGMQHQLAGSEVRSGFLHIPLLPQQAALQPGQPSMALETMIAGVRLALGVAWRVRNDVRQGGGTIA